MRAVLVRLNGIRQLALSETREWTPFEVPMLSCDNIWFFFVSLARENCYWVGCCREEKEKHLTTYLGVVDKPLGSVRNRFLRMVP